MAQPSRSDAAGALAADVTTWTITGRGGVFIRLIGQLVRPTRRHLRQRSDAAGRSGGTSALLLQVSHYFSTSDGPTTAHEFDLARWVRVVLAMAGHLFRLVHRL